MLRAVPFQMPVPESQPADLFTELRRLTADADRGDWPAVAAFLGGLHRLDDLAVACGQVEDRLSDQLLQRVPVTTRPGRWRRPSSGSAPSARLEHPRHRLGQRA